MTWIENGPREEWRSTKHEGIALVLQLRRDPAVSEVNLWRGPRDDPSKQVQVRVPGGE